jgi:hypothetical protein
MSRSHATNYTQLSRENPRSVLIAGAAARAAGVPRAAVAAITDAMTNVTGKGRREAAALLRAAAEEEERKKKAKKKKDAAPADDPPTDDPPTDGDDDDSEDEEDETIDDGEEGGTDEEEAGRAPFEEKPKKKKKASARSLAARISALEEQEVDASMTDLDRRCLAARGLPTTFGELRDLEIEAEHGVMRDQVRRVGPIVDIDPDEREVLDGMARASGFSNHAAMLKASKEAQALHPGLVRPDGSFGASAPVAPPQSAPKPPTARFSGKRTRTLSSGTCRTCGESIMACTLVLSSTVGMSHLGCGDESGGR